ncbi:MAG TPA: hypothetical protein VMH61_08700 [Candidatus Acidoferrales bacterium]|nr:hypothetical protein [Candidatus Acidoferrales bacterium]
MKQGRLLMPLTLAVLLAATSITALRADAATAKAATSAASTKRKSASLHQFSGVVTALDKSSLTVEKSGNNARSVVFARDPEMKTTGEIEKDARVTVWYRDENGHSVAHRVVVKTAATEH